MKKQNNGFSLIELLVVLVIMTVLIGIIVAAMNNAKANTRDGQRKSEIAKLQLALANYYSDHGFYPLPYPSGWSGTNTVPCGSGNGQTSGANAYIPGLVPNYIPVLPVDPLTTGTCSGFLYNSDGTNYKIRLQDSYEGTYPKVGEQYYDPVRPTSALMVCSGEPACSNW